MSRVGKQPIKIENNVTVDIKDGGEFDYKIITVKGPKGEIVRSIRRGIDIKTEEGNIIVERKDDSKMNRSLHGLYRTLIANMVNGVQNGFSKELEIHGVGYRAFLKGNDLELTLGYTHPILIKAPQGISFKVDNNVDVTITGIDKELVGKIAAEIREKRKPEPYKGKGIRYKGEIVKKKAGKSGSA